MRAWVVDRPGPLRTRPLRPVERARPEPGPGELRVRVVACAVCRTDLHLAEGDLAPCRPAVVPGHEVVGHVVARGPGAESFRLGDRVGIAWLRATCARCRFCRSDRENLCLSSAFTGWDAGGGFADYAAFSGERHPATRRPSAGSGTRPRASGRSTTSCSTGPPPDSAAAGTSWWTPPGPTLHAARLHDGWPATRAVSWSSWSATVRQPWRRRGWPGGRRHTPPRPTPRSAAGWQTPPPRGRRPCGSTRQA